MTAVSSTDRTAQHTGGSVVVSRGKRLSHAAGEPLSSKENSLGGFPSYVTSASELQHRS